MNFWDFNLDVFDAFIAIGILAVVFLISNVLRRKVGFIRRSLLPTAMIGGLIMLILKSIGAFDKLMDVGAIDKFFEAMTYHALGLGVIALTLKTTPEEKNKVNNTDVFNAGLITVNSYLIQAIVGAGITILLSIYVFTDLFPAAGFILPLGYGQGSGQAMTFGGIFEDTYGFEGGLSFGLTVATIGFLVACFVGVGHIYFRRKHGKLAAKADREFVSTEIIASPNEVPVTEAVDRLSIQVVLIILVYFLTFLFMYGVEKLPLGQFGTKTVKPMIWGFNFLIGSLFGALIKVIFKKLRKTNLMTRDYPNNYLLNRISGFMFDLMIIAGTAAIKIEVLEDLIVPLIIICLVGTVVTYFYVRWVSYKLFPNYQEEAFVSLFGMLTGTTSTGMILLREVDPGFETPAANNSVYQSFYAIALGFPLFYLLGIAPKGLKESIISVVIVIFMFIIFNIILLRSKLFKKKAKA